jgi:HprK-related kinase B
MPEMPTINGFAQKLLRDHVIKASLCLDLGGWNIKVSSNSQQLIDELADYFGCFVTGQDQPHQLEVTALEAPELDTGLDYTVKTPDPGKTKIKEEYADLPDGRIVRKRLTGMLFLFGGAQHIAVGPCLGNSNQVVNFINNRHIQLELDQGALLAHAAGVSQEGMGLAVAGFSGMGKSTLALHLMSLGLDFISNDRLLVRRYNGAPIMSGVAKLPRINPGTALNNPQLAGVIPESERGRFTSMDIDELWDLEHKYDVDIDRFFGQGRFKLQGSMKALGILNWQRISQDTVCRQVDLTQRLDLLKAFKKSTGLFYLPAIPGQDYSDRAYLEELRDVTVFEISGGVDFEYAAKTLLGELAKLES